MGDGLEDRAQRHDPLHAAPCGDIQERKRGLEPEAALVKRILGVAKSGDHILTEDEVKQKVQKAFRGQRMVRCPAAPSRTTGRTCVKSKKSSGSIVASGTAASWRTR